MPPFRATYRREKEEEPHSIPALFWKRLLTAALKTEGVQAAMVPVIDRDFSSKNAGSLRQYSDILSHYSHCTENESGSERSRKEMTGKEYEIVLSDTFSAFTVSVTVPGTVRFIVTFPLDIASGPSSPRRK